MLLNFLVLRSSTRPHGGSSAKGVGPTYAQAQRPTPPPFRSFNVLPITILDLQLGPINLNLLGLNVDTSPICLDITAHQGQGLLGDLLRGIANVLSSGVPLGEILSGLNETQLSTLNGGLTSVLNQGVFRPLTASPALVGATCNVLNLAIGPLDLNLRGLTVALDDCSNGPVTLDIRAQQGGGLLGDLLCGLSNLLNNPAQRLKLLAQIAAVLGSIFG